MATFPRTATGGTGGTGTTPVVGKELVVTAAGTYAVAADVVHAVIAPTVPVAATVAFTLPAATPGNPATRFVDRRSGTTETPSQFSVTPSGTGASANILGDVVFELVNDLGGGASIDLKPSSIGWTAG